MRTYSPIEASDSDRLRLLEQAVTVALSPLDHPDVFAWGDAVTRALCALAGAEAGAVLLPGTLGAAAWRAVDAASESADPDRPRVAAYDEATERLSAPQIDGGGLVRWARDDLAEGTRYAESARPPVGRRSLGLRVRTANGTVAAICVHRADWAIDGAPHHVVAAFRAIAPAFRTGADGWQRASTCRTDVARMLDSVADAALLYDTDGTLVHANPALERLTLEPSAARLRGDAQRLAWTIGALARRRLVGAANAAPARAAGPAGPNANPGVGAGPAGTSARDVRIGSTVYRLSGSVVGEHLLGSRPALLVTIVATVPEPLSDESLRRQFGLTAREIQVTRLLAEGLSNNEIADRIGVRFYTARNHVERTLAKLGVSSRHRVGPLLRNEQSEQNDADRASAA